MTYYPLMLSRCTFVVASMGQSACQQLNVTTQRLTSGH